MNTTAKHSHSCLILLLSVGFVGVIGLWLSSVGKLPKSFTDPSPTFSGATILHREKQLESKVATSRATSDLSNSDLISIRQAHEAGLHAVNLCRDGTLAARNPGQQWLTHFDGAGFTVSPDHGQWTWGFSLRAYGFESSTKLISSHAGISHEQNRTVYLWDESLSEWFVNKPEGLQQGWTIQQRPAGAGLGRPFVLDLNVRGTLRPIVMPDGKGVQFFDASNSVALSYSGLKAWDAHGTLLKVNFAATDSGIRVSVNEQHAIYPITIDPVAQQAYLKASNTEADDLFGAAIAISGDTAIVSARWEDSSATGINGNQTDNGLVTSGAVYVFIRNGSSWSQQAYLKASNTGSGDLFGYSIAISGDTLVVGAPGEDSSATGINGNQANNSAFESGAVYIFTRNGTSWSQQAYLKASNTGVIDAFGTSVAISGDTVVVGAPTEYSSATGINGNQSDNNTIDAGAAYVFTRNGTLWTQQAYLKASNTGSGDLFGDSIAISGDIVVVGARLEDSSATGINGVQTNNSATNSGAAYIFIRDGATWSQQAYLKASNTGNNDFFGSCVAIYEDTVVVGAGGEDSSATGINGNEVNNSAVDSGAAYVFTRNDATWSQQAYLKASNTGESDYFGSTLAIYGDTVVVGAGGEDSSATGVNGNEINNSAIDSGAAYVFTRNDTSWSQQAYFKASNTGSNDIFGSPVAIFGEIVLVGAESENSSSTGINGNDADNSASRSGAAYIFSFPKDNDGDGISDTWETTNGFNPSVANDVQTLDSDGDGVKDIFELFQGTDRNGAGSSYGLQNTQAIIDETTRELTTRYRRSTTQTAVARVLQWSDDLSLGFTSNTTRGGTTIGFSETVVESGSGYEVVEVTTEVTLGTPSKLFFNLGLQPVE